MSVETRSPFNLLAIISHPNRIIKHRRRRRRRQLCNFSLNELHPRFIRPTRAQLASENT